MSKYNLNLNEFDITSIKHEKYFILGIGGGNDVVGAYAIAMIIKRKNPQSQVLYGLCVASKENYNGFTKINDGLYVRDSSCDVPNNNHSLKLVQTLKKFDAELCEPYILIAHKKRKKERIVKDAVNYFSQHVIITVDNGGDSLTGGKDGKDGFDYKNLLYLKEMAIPFYHVILGLGCDGESSIEKIKEMIYRQQKSIVGEFSMDNIAGIISPIIDETKHPDRKNVDTTVIIVEVNNFVKNNAAAEQLYLIPRHERKTEIPYAWLNKAIVFKGHTGVTDCYDINC